MITIISNNPQTCESCRENMYLDEAGWDHNAPQWAPERGSVPVSVFSNHSVHLFSICGCCARKIEARQEAHRAKMEGAGEERGARGGEQGMIGGTGTGTDTRFGLWVVSPSEASHFGGPRTAVGCASWCLYSSLSWLFPWENMVCLCVLCVCETVRERERDSGEWICFSIEGADREDVSGERADVIILVFDGERMREREDPLDFKVAYSAQYSILFKLTLLNYSFLLLTS